MLSGTIESVEPTPGVTQADVERAITYRTNVVVENGEVRAVIGEGTDGVEKVILSIVGGTIVTASQGMESERALRGMGPLRQRQGHRRESGAHARDRPERKSRLRTQVVRRHHDREYMNGVTVTAGFDFSPDNPDGFPGMSGGVRIRAGDLVVTRPTGEAPTDASYPHDARGGQLDEPRDEFHGDFLAMTVDNLQEAIEPFLRGTDDRHREYVAPIVGESVPREIVFSHLDGDHVRVASKTEYDEHAENVRMEAMIGAPVDPCQFARELVGCRQTMVEYVENAYTDTWRDFSEEIEEFRPLQLELIEDLEDLLD